MKKFLAMVLGMVMVLSMVGCGKSDTPTTTDTTTSVSSENVSSGEEVTTDGPIRYESDQSVTEEKAETPIDKENACAIETITIVVDGAFGNITFTLPNGATEHGCIDTFNYPDGTQLTVTVYYFENVEEKEVHSTDFNPDTQKCEDIVRIIELISYTYEYEVSVAK